MAKSVNMYRIMTVEQLTQYRQQLRDEKETKEMALQRIAAEIERRKQRGEWVDCGLGRTIEPTR